MRFWVRWYGGDGQGDSRPLTVPVPMTWWCSGERGDGMSVLCAVVDAPDAASAWAQVRTFWPEAEASFVEAKPNGWQPEASRFPWPKETT